MFILYLFWIIRFFICKYLKLLLYASTCILFLYDYRFGMFLLCWNRRNKASWIPDFSLSFSWFLNFSNWEIFHAKRYFLSRSAKFILLRYMDFDPIFCVRFKFSFAWLKTDFQDFRNVVTRKILLSTHPDCSHCLRFSFPEWLLPSVCRITSLLILVSKIHYSCFSLSKPLKLFI